MMKQPKKANFKDPLTGELFQISNYITYGIGTDEETYKDKWKKVISNPKTGTVLEHIPAVWDGGAPALGTSTTSPEGIAKTKRMLQSRSDAHYEKEIKGNVKAIEKRQTDKL